MQRLHLQRLTAEGIGVVHQRVLSSGFCGVKWLCQVLCPASAKGRLLEGIGKLQDGDVAVAALANPVLRLQTLRM